MLSRIPSTRGLANCEALYLPHGTPGGGGEKHAAQVRLMPADHGTEGGVIKLPPLLVVTLRAPPKQEKKKKRKKMTIPDWMKTPKESTDEDRTQN